MIANLDPLDGPAPKPKPNAIQIGSPAFLNPAFHPKCIVVDAMDINRRIARLLGAGRCDDAQALHKAAITALSYPATPQCPFEPS